MKHAAIAGPSNNFALASDFTWTFDKCLPTSNESLMTRSSATFATLVPNGGDGRWTCTRYRRVKSSKIFSALEQLNASINDLLWLDQEFDREYVVDLLVRFATTSTA